MEAQEMPAQRAVAVAEWWRLTVAWLMVRFMLNLRQSADGVALQTAVQR